MDVRAMQKKIDEIVWYHEFDFGHGLKSKPATSKPATGDLDFRRRVWKFIESNLDQVDLKGKTVLDIGCWDGYWSFYAERRGAKSVLASDDRSQNWVEGNGLLLAKELLDSNIEVKQDVSIYRLAELDRKFDVIFCLGVYYHLIDPFYALAQIRHCCHDNTIVLLEGDGAAAGVMPQGLVYDLSDHYLPIFVPTRQAWQHMCEAAYLHVQSQTWMEYNENHVWNGPVPLVYDRLFTACKAFSGKNSFHHYEPPLGLHVYDERFQLKTTKLAAGYRTLSGRVKRLVGQPTGAPHQD
jgi:tRNA (mo5U34)-methyltransferase